MVDEKLVDAIVAAILEEMNKAAPQDTDPPKHDTRQDTILQEMQSTTSARVGVGRNGSRLRADTYLNFRADHAAAKDAVWLDVPQQILDDLSLQTVQTLCQDKNEFLTRPDLGRRLASESLDVIKKLNPRPCDVLVYFADGLSGKAIAANAPDMLPILLDGLRQQGLSCGKPFFVKYGRVAAQEQIAETVGATVVCTLIGERPGLGSPESMSAYITYHAKMGMPEAGRTVVSNIYAGGIPTVEAGAYLAELIGQIHAAKASGVNFNRA
ncbi:MAG: ethanolamine ammonia-lyase subunit EutC [Oscillospiraceae bacterium]|jgi:ethanolamine ammonia-lyase small subunit|nr:ethanolamine ammonia-lyase subunit EutC [Oscillospiraceae bacterium]